MSSTGNIYLERNHGLERALVRFRETLPAEWRVVMRALGDMQEEFLTLSLAKDGEHGQRALGSAGILRILRTIARDADGKPFEQDEKAKAKADAAAKTAAAAMGGDE